MAIRHPLGKRNRKVEIENRNSKIENGLSKELLNKSKKSTEKIENRKSKIENRKSNENFESVSQSNFIRFSTFDPVFPE